MCTKKRSTMGWQAWRWAAAVAAVFFLVTLGCGPQGASSLRCYKCNNCIKYELSQSQHCASTDTHCMKMDMETGTVQRTCGTEEMCQDSGKMMKTHYTKVSCCSEDNCNGSASLTPAPLLMGLLMIPAVAATGTLVIRRFLAVTFC
ncbi:uncharacterized protein LOC135201058 isoform X2 [Macrobrachium nipponense]|uniref:uncharacterized protein LOC135201058 isoform X2 n=1 Tax=Macrobrachium nipponense TaxID=159736 RepID=UPI0030C8C04C